MTASTQTLFSAALEKKQKCVMEVPLEPASTSKANILPFGNTLHYPGCACPPSWTPGARVCDRVDALVSRSHQLFLDKRISPNRPLRVCYMLPHHNITGGMKCLVEHIRLLRQRGHYTIAVHRSDSAKRAMPPWTTVEADADVVCNLHQRLSDVYPAQDIDVVVVGIFHQVAELLAGVAAPVLYWEQGHEWIFGDPIRLQSAQNYQKQDQLFHMVMHLPCVLAGVSSAVLDILQQEFGRSALLIPNGIDCDRFSPGPWVTSAAAAAAAAAVAAAGSSDLQQQQQQGADGKGSFGQQFAAGDCLQQQQQQLAGVDAMQTDCPAAAAAVAAAAPAPVGDTDVVTDLAVDPANHNSAISSNTIAVADCCQQQQQRDGNGVTLELDCQVQQQQQDLAAAIESQQQQQQHGRKRILIVGNPALPLKGFPTAIAALAAVAAMMPIEVRWLCQVQPTAAHVPNLPLVDFPLDIIVSPNQATLPALYRGNDVFLFTSRYEAWGMPVLEAMASGVPVVTTDCLGIRTFCKHGENCLIAAPDDAAGVAQHLLSVLSNPELTKKLSTAGRETALQYTPNKVMDHLESVLYSLTACGQELLQLRQSCIVELQQACAQASEACTRPVQQQLQALQQHLQQHQQRLALLQQQRQQQQTIQLQSLRVLQQLNIAGPLRQQQQQQQQWDVPLQASLLMPFLQVQQQQQPGLLQLQFRSSGALSQHGLGNPTAAAAAAVVGDVRNLLAASQQQQQLLPTSMLQQQQHSQEQQLLHLRTSQNLQQQQQQGSALKVLQQLQHSQQQQQHSHQMLLPTSSLHQQFSNQLLLPSSSLQQQQYSSQLLLPSLSLQQQQQYRDQSLLPSSSLQQQQQHSNQMLLPSSSFQQQYSSQLLLPASGLQQQQQFGVMSAFQLQNHLQQQQQQQQGVPGLYAQQQQQQQQEFQQLQLPLGFSQQQQQQQLPQQQLQLLLSHSQQQQQLLPSLGMSMHHQQQQLLGLQQLPQ